MLVYRLGAKFAESGSVTILRNGYNGIREALPQENTNEDGVACKACFTGFRK